MAGTGRNRWRCEMPMAMLVRLFRERTFALTRSDIFFGERCGGAVIYGDEYAENRGVSDRYGFGGKIIGLLRGACLPWAHPHSASKLDPPLDGAAARARK
jgi:hypothetical protein